MQVASVLPWVALAVISLVALVLLWRYAALRRGIRRFQIEVLSDTANPTPVRELASLSRTVRKVIGDLAEQVRQLTAERDRLSTVLDQMTDGVLIADSGGLVQYSNPAARDILEVAEPVGRSLTEVLRDHRLVDVWKRSSSLGEIRSESVELAARQRYLQLIAMPDSHAGGSLLLLQDLTRLRRLELVRRDFVSNISHELRTPLATLKALAETLLAGAAADPQAGPEFLQRVVGEVDALARMSDELLELSAIESGKAELSLEDCDVGRLLHSAVERMRPQAQRAGVRLDADAPESVPTLRADSVRLEQVLVSLIHNAIKFTPPGGVIQLRAAKSDEALPGHAATAVEISVQDTGQGIPAEHLPRIFERFYTVDRARSRGGTGLGLAIARHIVEAHGGRIWAQSIEGKGSIFHILLPAAT